MVLRSCVVGALRDQTWAKQFVYDSDLTPLAVAIYGKTNQPYIVVYSDSDDAAMTDIGDYYQSKQRLVTIAIEIGIASTIRDPDTGAIQLQFAANDEGMEIACDVISSQAIAAIYGNPYSAWGDLFKRMTTATKKITSRRGGQSQQGIRFAARRLLFMVQPMFDFAPGIVPPATHPIWDFITLASQSAATTGQTDIGVIVQNLLTKTDNPDWRQAQTLLGLSTDAVKELMVPGDPLPYPELEVPPLPPADTNEFPPPLGEVDIADPDRPTDPPVPVTPTNAPPVNPNTPVPNPLNPAWWNEIFE